MHTRSQIYLKRTVSNNQIQETNFLHVKCQTYIPGRQFAYLDLYFGCRMSRPLNFGQDPPLPKIETRSQIYLKRTRFK